jgi:ribosomal protein S11
MALKANIVIDQGTSFATTIDVTDEEGNIVDLTGFTGAAQMRKHYTSSTFYAFTVSITAATGEVTLAMSANVTNNVAPGRYMFDCELNDGTGTISRLVEGIVTVTPGVTR